MSFKNDSKQCAEFVYNFALDGGAVSTIVLSGKAGQAALPDGAIVTDVYMKVLTTCTSGGAATVAIGNSSDVDGYIEAQAVAGLTAGAMFSSQVNGGALLWDDTEDAGIAYLADSANERAVVISIAAAALTAGKLGVVVEYSLANFGHR